MPDTLVEMVHRLHEIRERRIVMVIEHLVDVDRLGLPLDHDTVDLTDAVGAVELFEGIFADQDFREILLAGALSLEARLTPSPISV